VEIHNFFFMILCSIESSKSVTLYNSLIALFTNFMLNKCSFLSENLSDPKLLNGIYLHGATSKKIEFELSIRLKVPKVIPVGILPNFLLRVLSVCECVCVCVCVCV